MTFQYREDIDWLRAIAVLSVVAFHFEAPVWGGFVGVDIFFVISGYLITAIIQSELKSGAFAFARFYERRLRRLLPALYAMVALTALPSFHYLLTSERAEFFRSIAAVVTFTSNVFFWFQTGYFDHAAAEKPLLHTWSLAVEEQFYLVLPVTLWAISLLARGRRLVPTFRSSHSASAPPFANFGKPWAPANFLIPVPLFHLKFLDGICSLRRRNFKWAALALPATLVVLSLASFALSIWLMKSGRSASAFFMSPPRAWEFLIGGIVSIEGFPVLRRRLSQNIVRGAALVLLAIPIFGLRQGPGFPGFNALTPCIGAAMFIWSGIGVPTKPRHALAPLEIARFFGRISYSLYLWHWPLFTFARFSKNGLVLDVTDRLALFALTVAISYLSWRFVEQPFRDRTLVPSRRSAFGMAFAASVALMVVSASGFFTSRNPSEADQQARQLEAYDNYDIASLYRSGTCFAPANGTFGDACLSLASGKPNWLLWGDSFAAQYFPGLREFAVPHGVNLLQATQPACMPTVNAAAQGNISCRDFAAQMAGFFRDHRPDLVVMAGDWLEYGRGSRFDGMIADLKRTVAGLNDSGIPVVLLGPAVQFKARLPSMLLRAHLRGADARADDFVLADIFAFGQRMKTALPRSAKFSFVSVTDAVCPERQCPLTLQGGVPLAWDHAHLTAEGSVHVMDKVAPLLDVASSFRGDAPGSAQDADR